MASLAERLKPERRSRSGPPGEGRSLRLVLVIRPSLSVLPHLQQPLNVGDPDSGDRHPRLRPDLRDRLRGHRPVRRARCWRCPASSSAGRPTVANLPLGGPLALGIGAERCGLINGLLITFGKLPPFIATLAMLERGAGAGAGDLGGRPDQPDTGVRLAPRGHASAVVPVPVILMLVMGPSPPWCSAAPTRAAHVRHRRQRGGRRLSGMNVSRQKLVIYALSGALRRRRRHPAHRPAGLGPAAGRLHLRARRHRRGRDRRRQPLGGVGKASGTLIGALILARAAQRPEPAERLGVLAAGRHRRRDRPRGDDGHPETQEALEGGEAMRTRATMLAAIVAGGSGGGPGGRLPARGGEEGREEAEDRALCLYAEQPVLRAAAQRRPAGRGRGGASSSSPTRRTTPPPSRTTSRTSLPSRSTRSWSTRSTRRP